MQPDHNATQPGHLILSSGEVFHGFLPNWQNADVFGEVVFNTSMVGYVEAMTDPSYAGQLLTFTYPLIGNYGVPKQQDWESNKIHAAAIIVSEAAQFYSHHQAKESLFDWCQSQGVPILFGVDTRALAKTISHQGVCPAVVSLSDKKPSEFVDINQQHLVKQVSISEPVTVGEGDKTIIAVDCGMKENIMRHLSQFPVTIKRVPFDYDFTNEDYDAVFFSNGPGDPAMCTETIAIAQKVLQGDKPVFGICLGSQIMALAMGAQTYKLPFGHRAQNHPCIEEGTDKCVLTSQNHGFCIKEDSLPDEWRVLYRNLNDNTVQGIAHKSKPFFSVQFHPEEAPGPVDTQFLFHRFYETIIGKSA